MPYLLRCESNIITDHGAVLNIMTDPGSVLNIITNHIAVLKIIFKLLRLNFITVTKHDCTAYPLSPSFILSTTSSATFLVSCASDSHIWHSFAASFSICIDGSLLLAEQSLSCCLNAVATREYLLYELEW